MRILLIVLGVVAIATWIVALVSAISMVRRRVPEVSLARLAFHGHLFFSSASFTPDAAPYRRRFLLCFGVFFVVVIAGVALAMFAASTPL